MQPNEKIAAWLDRFSLYSGYATALYGLLVVIGWVCNIPILTTSVPGEMHTRFLAGIGFAAAGACLVLMKTSCKPAAVQMGRFLAVSVLLLGVLSLVDLALGRSIVSGPAYALERVYDPLAGRLPPAATLVLTFVGFSLVLQQSRWRFKYWGGQACAFVVLCLGLATLVGRWYGMAPLTQFAGHAIQLVTVPALFAVILGTGMLSVNCRAGFARVLCSDGIGGKTARMLVPVVFLLTVTVGRLSLLAEQRGIYGPISEQVVGHMSLLAAFVVLVWWSAFSLDRAESVVKQTTQEIARQREMLKLIVDSISEGLVVVDSQGKFILFNKAAKGIHGLGATDTEPDQWPQLYKMFLPDGKTPVDSKDLPLVRALLGDSVDDFEMYVRPDGAAAGIWVSTNGRPMYDGEGNLLGALATMRDITERKAAEERISEFYSTTSHELRTPLTSIRVALGVIEGGTLGQLTPQAKRLVSIGREETDRLIRMVNEMLDMKKIQAGKLELKLADISSVELVTTALDGLSATAAAAGIRLELVAKTDAQVRADADRVAQVLSNLVMNAIKFAPRDSTVTVSVEQDNHAFVKFTISDCGPGISKEDQARLFSPFLQLDTGRGGTGLGLAISKSIVQQHGGRIGVKSELGGGSKFWFKIPRSHVAPIQAHPREVPVAVIADNDFATRQILTQNLERLGLECLQAADGEDALRVIESEPPDLIVLEVPLPKIDGFAMVEHLKATACANVPMITYTAEDLSGANKSRLELGPTIHLIKTRSSMSELEQAVQRLLGDRLRSASTSFLPSDEKGSPDLTMPPGQSLGNIDV